MDKPKTTFSPLFLVLTTLFVTCLLLSNIIAGKIANFAGIPFPAGVILFPITYILGDVFTEVYGFRKTRLVIWIGFAANILMALVFLATIALPFPDFFKGQDAYAAVLGMTPRLVLASLVAYWAGEFANSLTLSVMKRATKGRFLWTRTIGSTVIGQGIDTMLFIAIAFVGLVPLPVLGTMFVTQYLFKVGYETLFTPITYVVVRSIKKIEGIDVYDDPSAYNPFAVKSES